MSHGRRRVKHVKTFEERLAEEAVRFRKAAEEAPPGMARERARQAETASRISGWLRSPSLQTPK